MDVTAAQAWPERHTPVPPFTPEEIGRACVALAACSETPPTLPGKQWTEAELRVSLQSTCLIGGLSIRNAAEHVIPFEGFQSWRFLIQSALDAGGDCAPLRAILPPGELRYFACDEAGCYMNEPSSITCDGDVASIETSIDVVTRDCTHSDTHCSVTSPTGCTDRQLTRCSGGADRCDGDILLGCNACGFVTYLDCSWDGGHCVELDDGARCVSPSDSTPCPRLPQGCNGTTLSVCAAGTALNVDCRAIGARSCTTIPYIDPYLDLSSRPQTAAYCTTVDQSAAD